MRRYPAKDHANKVVSELLKILPESWRGKRQAILLQAAPVMCRHDTDRELPYHQEGNFSYVTGCPIDSASVLISIPEGTHELFIPPADPLVTMWSVAPPTVEEAEARLESDNIRYTTELEARLPKDITIHCLPMTTEFPALPSALVKLSKDQICSEYLVTACQMARLTKDEAEIDLIREANRISSAAHETLMKELGRFSQGRRKHERKLGDGVHKWEVESEGDAEALFVATCKRAGRIIRNSALQAYLPICASGTRASTLHYVCNDKVFPSMPRKAGDASFAPRRGRGCCGAETHDHASHHIDPFEPQILLIDAGCEWHDYASDITRTIPVGNGGKYTDKAADIYDTVLGMQKECENMVRPGVHWDTIHLHGHKVLIEQFLKLGIFKGDPEEILRSGVTAAFFPHGLGHSLGLDVHDSLQYLRQVHMDLPKESAITPKLYTYLRIRRQLEKNMVLTVEPGCYFAPQLMQEHGVWTSPFVVKEKLEEYRSVGGVRIEDVVVVREEKCENLTIVPRDREIIERMCSGQ